MGSERPRALAGCCVTEDQSEEDFAVDEAFPDVEFPNWSTCDRLLPHAQACADRITQFHFEFTEAALLRERWLFAKHPSE